MLPAAVELRNLVSRRDKRLTGMRAVAVCVCLMTPLALVGLVGLSLVRANIGVDPLFGVQGFVLCPLRGQGCEGPLDVESGWHVSDTTDRLGRRGFENNGAFYYCQPPPGVPREDCEVGFAVTGSTYLLALLLAGLLVPVFALLLHARERRAAERDEARIRTLAAGLGQPVPEPGGRGGLLLAAGALLVLLTGSCASGVIFVESLFW